jgi:hypothetical protein
VDPGPISIILLSPVYLTRTVYFTRILLSLSTRYAHNLCFKQTGEIDNLIVSWEQSTWLCVCRFHVATGRRRVNKCRKRRPCWSAIKPVCITFSRLSLLSKIDIPGFLTERKFAAIFITPSSWGSQRAGHLPCNKQPPCPSGKTVSPVQIGCQYVYSLPLMSHRTRWETPRGRYNEHNSTFSLSMKPKFNRPIGERKHF